MIDSPEIKQTEKALLVGVIHGTLDQNTVDEHLEELRLLAQTAGAKVIGEITQKLSRINPSFFIGSGKAEQIINQAKELGVSLIIFDDELSPGQIKNYTKLTEEVKVIDRSGLILDIFKQHAQTKEAKTQVELAQLEYMLPRLTRAWTHLERQMGGIGTRAGAGETQIEVDRRLIRTRISKLKQELGKIERERDTQSKRRGNQFKVALVGYTNAGKSTLMKAISGADVFIQDQLFATLDTTVRSVELDSSHAILLSDTVGFVRKLPHHLVASFRSTLKEVVDADLILLVLDASSSQVEDHYQTIISVLKELGADRHPIQIVLNKIDRNEAEEHINYLKRKYTEGIYVSALNSLRIDSLSQRIMEIMDENFQIVDLQFSYQDSKNMALAQEGVDVLERSYDDDGVRLKIKGASWRINQIQSSLFK
ncbi:MAG: GTPase HflX [Candidatus Marinimicrobia bacterium]|jgi:GTP-binding protein HflX|nr:GTPase HflX [Candidatus Neomarinimicrobiota bacterium]MBT3947163.1 GTPase HflX [Candidatus Neomarinimicrobiota bacterium]MBT4063715.1 GTPase HflX [Candidatus Neomarinimicrobiota bacterium]MBT4453267.1 GTPase HflX [Candidatus Neomarinimicrobiota bacterium]MBT4736284.1 GTPase HflX [Candidatus Neomarinimicrobiota bacterium]|tara:strand:- start:3201 stop:4472 length:1272 start_codon:yes stop_codon:yes gene_type:complete